MNLKIILKDLIEDRGITVTNLSKATQIPPQTIHNWLTGVEPRSFKQVKKVADFLGVTLDYLCFGIVAKNNSIESYGDEINAGIFEVVLRRVKNNNKYTKRGASNE